MKKNFTYLNSIVNYVKTSLIKQISDMECMPLYEGLKDNIGIYLEQNIGITKCDGSIFENVLNYIFLNAHKVFETQVVITDRNIEKPIAKL